jgi:hypothetical protein
LTANSWRGLFALLVLNTFTERHQRFHLHALRAGDRKRRSDSGGDEPADQSSAWRQVVSEIRRLAILANPEIPVGSVVPLEQIAGNSIADLRSKIWIFLSFAATALLLAAIGIDGLMSHSVSQRTL